MDAQLGLTTTLHFHRRNTDNFADVHLCADSQRDKRYRSGVAHFRYQRSGSTQTKVAQQSEVDRVARQFIEAMRKWGWSEHTVRAYELGVTFFLRWLMLDTKIESLREITGETIAAWREELGPVEGRIINALHRSFRKDVRRVSNRQQRRE